MKFILTESYRLNVVKLYTNERSDGWGERIYIEKRINSDSWWLWHASTSSSKFISHNNALEFSSFDAAVAYAEIME